MYRAFIFLKRGFIILFSYRMAFVLQLVGMLFSVASFYFLAKLVGVTNNPLLARYGGNYLSFLIIGVIFQSFVSTSLGSFNGAIREEQMMGTLEFLLMSKTSLSRILAYSALWSFISASLSGILMLLMAILVFGLKLNVNLLLSLLILILAVVGMSGIGMISAGIILVVKQGDPVTWVFGAVSGLLSGVYYPIEILPKFLRGISYVLPTTHALIALRQSLMTNSSFASMKGEILILVVFCLITVPLGIVSFYFGFNKARKDGTLAFY